MKINNLIGTPAASLADCRSHFPSKCSFSAPLRGCSAVLASMVLAPLVIASTASSGGQFLGLAVERPSALDSHASVMYDEEPTDQKKRYQMWWFCSLSGEQDIPLSGKGRLNVPSGYIGPTDRICYSHRSANGDWSATEVVLRGSFGGHPEVTGDDHLVGSPSVIRVGEYYLMVYEGYGNWIEPLNLFYNPHHGDSWVTPGANIVGDPKGARSGYEYATTFGFVSMAPKAGMHPVYGSIVEYSAGNPNHYLHRDPNAGPLNSTRLNSGQPLFWLYPRGKNGCGSNRVPITSIFSGVASDTGIQNSDGAHGANGDISVVEHLGCAYESLDSPELVGALQNKVFLAYSLKGESWTRLAGWETGGAIAVPNIQTGIRYSPPRGVLTGDSVTDQNKWTPKRHYGAGRPTILSRDGKVQVFWRLEDESDKGHYLMSVNQGDWKSSYRWAVAYRDRTRIEKWEKAGDDIAWSPKLKTYVMAKSRHNRQCDVGQTIKEIWNAGNTAMDTFSLTPAILTANLGSRPQFLLKPCRGVVDEPNRPDMEDVLVPTSPSGNMRGFGRATGDVALARNPLGHTLDFPGYTAFHVFYQSYNRLQFEQVGGNNTGKVLFDSPIEHHAEIGHSLFFVFD